MKHVLIITALVLASLFLLLSLVVHLHGFREWDYANLLFLQAAFPRAVDWPFSLLSLLGSFEVTLLVMAGLLLWALPQRRWRVSLGLLFVLSAGIEFLGKTFINQPDVPGRFYRGVLFFPVPSGTLYTAFSFPSGHAARSAFITVLLLAILYQSHASRWIKRLGALLMVAAEGVMLVSRVYLGEHWASDVVGGVLLGVLLALPAVQWAVESRRGMQVLSLERVEPESAIPRNLRYRGRAQ